MKISVKDMTISAVFVAVTCIIAAIPLGFNIMGVAATLQTFAIAFAGYVLGKKRGAFVAALYVILGLIIPVYSNMTSGLGVLLGPTGGFLWGFIIMAFLCGMSSEYEKTWIKVMLTFLGIGCCHIIGVAQFAFVMDMEIWGSVLVVTLPYLPKDILMIALAWMLAQPVRRGILRLR